MKNRKRTGKYAVLFLFIFTVLILGMLITNIPKKDKKIVVGFITTGDVDEPGWNKSHYDGVKSACKACNVDLICKENIPEGKGKCKKAIRELIKEGAGMIMLNSYGYSEEVKEEIKKYPNIAFYGNSPEYYGQNLSSYFSRMYQVRYLSGIVAGCVTKTNKIGYVAAKKNNEVIRGIDAFALGVRKVNKKAKVIVKWTDCWKNEKAERQASRVLIDKAKVDVLTFHQNDFTVLDEAEKAGIYSIGYNQIDKNLSDKCLTTCYCHWEKIYTHLIKEYLQGKTNKEENYWTDLKDDGVALSDLSDCVSWQVREEVEKAKVDILRGRDVFSGVIYDRDGKLRCEKDEIIKDDALLRRLDWYVEGVEFYD